MTLCSTLKSLQVNPTIALTMEVIRDGRVEVAALRWVFTGE